MLELQQDTERRIVEGCVENDRLAQEQLFKLHFGTMMGMCLRYTQDKEEARSIVNQGFLKVFQKIHTFRFEGSLQGWIRKLVFNALSDYFKKKAKLVNLVPIEEHQEISQRAKVLDDFYVSDLLVLVDRLPPATKEVFRLYALEGFSHPEIADQVKISVGTSKWHLANARKLLKNIISTNKSQLDLYAG